MTRRRLSVVRSANQKCWQQRTPIASAPQRQGIRGRHAATSNGRTSAVTARRACELDPAERLASIRLGLCMPKKVTMDAFDDVRLPRPVMLRRAKPTFRARLALWKLVYLAFALGLSSSVAATPEDDAQTERLRTTCQSAVDAVRNEIDRRRTTYSILVVLGAIAATAGSIAAGISSRDSTRKIGAAVGALSGICTAGIQTLPDTKPAQDRLVAMDRQQIVGEKVFAQLDLLEDSRARREYVKFVRARYTECTAEIPPTPPDLPTQQVLAMVSPTPPASSVASVETASAAAAPLEMVAALKVAQSYWVQISTGELNGLKSQARALVAKGEPARVYSARCNDVPCYTLVLGPFETREQATVKALPGRLVTRGKTLESEQPL